MINVVANNNYGYEIENRGFGRSHRIVMPFAPLIPVCSWMVVKFGAAAPHLSGKLTFLFWRRRNNASVRSPKYDFNMETETSEENGTLFLWLKCATM